MCNFNLDFTSISCFTSKNILSKVISIHHVSMLTSPSTYHKIHFRIKWAVNPLSQFINCKFQKYVSVSICHCYRASFMKSLFIAYLERWMVSFHGSPGLISFYCECDVSFLFCLFCYFCCRVYYLLSYWGKFVNTHNKAV